MDGAPLEVAFVDLVKRLVRSYLRDQAGCTGAGFCKLRCGTRRGHGGVFHSPLSLFTRVVVSVHESSALPIMPVPPGPGAASKPHRHPD